MKDFNLNTLGLLSKDNLIEIIVCLVGDAEYPDEELSHVGGLVKRIVNDKKESLKIELEALQGKLLGKQSELQAITEIFN